MRNLHVGLTMILGMLLSCTSVAEDEVTVKRSERKRDGQVVRTTESFFRNGKQILLVVKTRGTNGTWKVTRSYEIGKDVSLSESDEDSDGHFETLIIFQEGKSLEAFDRMKEGNVVPFSPAKLDALRKQFSELSEFFEDTNGKEENK